MNKTDILNSLNDKEERMIFSKIFNQMDFSEKRNTCTYTDFLDPIKAGKFLSLTGCKNSLVFGGYDEAERVIIGFGEDINFNNFPIKKIKIFYNNKYVKNLTHRDFLGSVLALSIERSKIGDIVVSDDNAVIFVISDIADFICSNLEKVKNATVKCSVSDGYFSLEKKEITEKRITVASLRIDALISQCFNISRSKANDFINSEKVFVNWISVINNSKIINEGDIITLRGKGRVKIKEITGKTKKDRISAIILKYQD